MRFKTLLNCANDSLIFIEQSENIWGRRDSNPDLPVTPSSECAWSGAGGPSQVRRRPPRLCFSVLLFLSVVVRTSCFIRFVFSGRARQPFFVPKPLNTSALELASMVAPRHRSRTFRKVMRRTPGGKTVTHHERRKPSKAHCGVCGTVLSGVPTDTPAQIRKLAKTQRRPERPYGGVLCSACMRKKIKQDIQASRQ